jgi:hypothetical protein
MFRACAAAAFVFVLVNPAIDGDWCGEKGLHLTIKGPEITTPSGVTLKGNYYRMNLPMSLHQVMPSQACRFILGNSVKN